MEIVNLPAIRSAPPPPMVVGMPNQQELMVYQTWAKSAFDSQMYRNVGKESAIMMIMLAAREYGIGPAQALNGGLHIIEGKVELSARVMSALIRRAKHKLNIVESNHKICTIYGERADTGEHHTVSYTIEEAQNAGLIKEKSGWKKTPTDMLYARAISRLARQLFSDVVGIGYVEGEIADCRASDEVLEPIHQPELDEGSLEAELLNHFDKEEHGLVAEFVREIGEHYKWSKRDTIIKLLEDVQELSRNFNTWKDRRKT